MIGRVFLTEKRKEGGRREVITFPLKDLFGLDSIEIASGYEIFDLGLWD